jgi:hypothetical protein
MKPRPRGVSSFSTLVDTEYEVREALLDAPGRGEAS